MIAILVSFPKPISFFIDGCASFYDQRTKRSRWSYVDSKYQYGNPEPGEYVLSARSSYGAEGTATEPRDANYSDYGQDMLPYILQTTTYMGHRR